MPFNPDIEIDEPGNLSNISFIARKPEPLGTEFKVVCCSRTGIILLLEIQRGKKGMCSLPYAEELIKTAACTARLIDGTRTTSNTDDVSGDDEKQEKSREKDTYFGDAWFASTDAAIKATQQGVHFVGVVKTSLNRYPKKEIKKQMESWPPGSHLLLEGVVEGVTLFALGYKYCKKKVLCFLFTDGAGHTGPGDPYVARWKDLNGNTVRKYIKRPDIVTKYFRNSNAVDKHNHARQGELQLEKCWITSNGFFRVATTLFSMTVTDCWKAYKFHLPEGHRHKDMTVVEFASLLTQDLLDNMLSREIPDKLEGTSVAHTIDVAGTLSNLKQGPRTGSVITVDTGNRGKECVDTERLTQDSFLQEIDLYESEDEKRNRLLPQPTKPDNTPGNILEKHRVVLFDGNTRYARTVKKGRKKDLVHGVRRIRGKCHYCSKRTSYFCPTCPPQRHSKVHWCCGPPADLTPRSNDKHVMCQRMHEKWWKRRIETEEAEATDEEYAFEAV